MLKLHLIVKLTVLLTAKNLFNDDDSDEDNDDAVETSIIQYIYRLTTYVWVVISNKTNYFWLRRQDNKNPSIITELPVYKFPFIMA